MSNTLQNHPDIVASGTRPVELIRPLTRIELLWKQRIYEKLLQALDLSLLNSLDATQACFQIREISMRLLVEAAAPMSPRQRQFIVKRIEDEVMGHGPGVPEN
jgi:hypothetical protein